MNKSLKKMKLLPMKKYFLLTLICLLAASANAQLAAVSYQDGTDKLNGLAAVPKKPLTGKPGILVLPAWKGIDKHAKDSADKLAALGYYTFVADIYGEGHYPTDTKQAGERAGFYKKNYTQYQRRIAIALAQLVDAGANPDKIVVIGYCFGGTGALEAARAQLPVKGVVSFHGGLGKDASRPVSELKSKILVCHGADDSYVPETEVADFRNEMKTAKADWQLVYYANAVHAFTDPEAGNDNSKGAAYNEKADKRSWEHLLIFLKEVL